MKYWTLRDEIYNSLHRWPSMVIFFALGCVLGWALSFLLLSSYRATTQIYVGLNPYRAYSDSRWLALAKPKYSNIDDYKNWQMSELESAIYLDEILQETLKKLREDDPYWQQVDIYELNSMLEAEWRSAGTWSLVAESSSPERAEQAVRAWSEIAVIRVQDAVKSAQRTAIIDEELQSVIEELLQVRTRKETLKTSRFALKEWADTARGPAMNEHLDPIERWKVESIAAGAAQFTPGWMALLDEQPDENAPPEAYIEWIDQISATIDNELSLLEPRSKKLNAEQSQLESQYSQVSKSSLGLSPSIVIEGLQNAPTKRLKPTGNLVLIGGIIGLSSWILLQLVIISRSKPEQ
jgi:capsular polysaccharide biosynthesis protein